MSKPKDSSLTSRYTTKVGKDNMLPKGTKQRKENTYLHNFFLFSYLHGLHEMMVLLHLDFIIGHERRLKMKRKEIQTQTQKI
jgi:hypothetical protein